MARDLPKIKCEGGCKWLRRYSFPGNPYFCVCGKLGVPLTNGYAMLHYAQHCGRVPLNFGGVPLALKDIKDVALMVLCALFDGFTIFWDVVLKPLINRATLKEILRGIIVMGKRLISLAIIYSVYNIWENDLSGQPCPCPIANLECRIITEAKDVPDGFGWFRKTSFDRHAIGNAKQALDRGVVIFAGFVNGRLVYTSGVWLGKQAHNTVPWLSRQQFGQVVNVGGDFTLPYYRHIGIHTYMQGQIFRYLRQAGVSRAWSHQRRDNIAARNSAIKLGSYLWGQIHYVSLLSKFTLRWIRPACGRSGIENIKKEVTT